MSSLASIFGEVKKLICNCKDESKTIEILTNQLNACEARNLELQRERKVVDERWHERIQSKDNEINELMRLLIKRGRK